MLYRGMTGGNSESHWGILGGFLALPGTTRVPQSTVVVPLLRQPLALVSQPRDIFYVLFFLYVRNEV